MTLKVGDKVRIRSDLKARDYDEKKGIISISIPMEEYAGQEAQITHLRTVSGYWKQCYDIDTDSGMWAWQENMFEPLKEENEI